MILSSFALIAAACGSTSSPPSELAFNTGNEPSTPPPSWQLLGIGPDGRNLLIETKPADCLRSQDIQLTASVRSVEILFFDTAFPEPTSCTGDSSDGLHHVLIEDGLRDRDLLGCGVEDCRTTTDRSPFSSVGIVEAADNAIGVQNHAGLDGYDTTGTLVSETDVLAPRSELFAVDESTAVTNDSEGNAVAVDLLSGEELWRGTGDIRAVDENTVYLCGTDANRRLRAHDASTGALIWESEFSCAFVSSVDQILTVVGSDPDDPAGEQLLLNLDPVSGAVLVREPLPQGLENLLAETAFIGTASNVAMFTSYQTATGYDLVTHAALPSINIDPNGQRSDFDRSTLAVDGDTVWLLDRQASTISRLDPRTGEKLWTTEIPVTAEFDAAVSNDIAYVLTFQALIALDNTTGETLWSQYRSSQSPN